MTAAAIVYLSACLALVYSGFCRLVRTDTTTALPIRAVMWLLTVSALAAFGAVLVWGHRPGWADAALAAAMAAVQVATASLWRDGVPHCYRRDCQ